MTFLKRTGFFSQNASPTKYLLPQNTAFMALNPGLIMKDNRGGKGRSVEGRERGKRKREKER
jgi:hypothetical protein